jgi:hypothetical protein
VAGTTAQQSSVLEQARGLLPVCALAVAVVAALTDPGSATDRAFAALSTAAFVA